MLLNRFPEDRLRTLRSGGENATYSAPSPREWREAEAELQGGAATPIQPSSRPRRLPSLSPRIGEAFPCANGDTALIAAVVGRDEQIWFVVDHTGRRHALRRLMLEWTHMPPNVAVPAPGDTIVCSGAEANVKVVIGQAAKGGWVVMDGSGEAHAVLHSRSGRWMSFGSASALR